MKNERALGILQLNLYLKGAMFEFWSGYFYLVFFSFPTYQNLILSRYEHDRFLPNNIQFVLPQMYHRRRH
jgi:hypothetical protein